MVLGRSVLHGQVEIHSVPSKVRFRCASCSARRSGLGSLRAFQVGLVSRSVGWQHCASIGLGSLRGGVAVVGRSQAYGTASQVL